ncbi:hypothetical protein GCM10022227_11210 [Streptomyces sedi]
MTSAQQGTPSGKLSGRAAMGGDLLKDGLAAGLAAGSWQRRAPLPTLATGAPVRSSGGSEPGARPRP